MVDVTLNDSIKRESVHKARWGSGKRRAKLYECKVLFSHSETSRCEKVTQALIEHSRTRKLDFYATESSDLLYSQKILTEKRLDVLDQLKFCLLE